MQEYTNTNIPSQGSSQHSSLLVLVVSIVVAILAGGIVGYFIGSSIGKKGGQSYDDGYAAGFEAARKKLAENGVPFSEDRPKTNRISGKITKISGSEITISVPPMSPLDDPTLRTIVVAGDTDIYMLEERSAGEVEGEMRAYNEKMAAFNPDDQEGAMPEPPMPFTRKPIALVDLSEGDVITALSAETIQKTGNVTAKSIEVSPVQQDVPGTIPGELMSEPPALEGDAAVNQVGDLPDVSSGAPDGHVELPEV